MALDKGNRDNQLNGDHWHDQDQCSAAKQASGNYGLERHAHSEETSLANA
jgi:hypothetical protein